MSAMRCVAGDAEVDAQFMCEIVTFKQKFLKQTVLDRFDIQVGLHQVSSS